jgi:hypothetical protein
LIQQQLKPYTVLVATKNAVGRQRKIAVETNGLALVVDNLILIAKNVKDAKKALKIKIF